MRCCHLRRSISRIETAASRSGGHHKAYPPEKHQQTQKSCVVAPLNFRVTAKQRQRRSKSYCRIKYRRILVAALKIGYFTRRCARSLLGIGNNARARLYARGNAGRSSMNAARSGLAPGTPHGAKPARARRTRAPRQHRAHIIARSEEKKKERRQSMREEKAAYERQ